MRYVVTGATGFVGGHLARQLADSGHTVIAPVRSLPKARPLAEAGITVVPGDVTRPGSLADTFAGSDGVFHVAGWYQVGSDRPQDGWRINVAGTRNVLQAAADAGVPRVVYTSTLAVNSDTRGRVADESYRFTGRHVSVYDQTKAEAHRIAEWFAAGGLDVVTVMPGGIYGPGDTSQVGHLIEQVVQGRPAVAPAGLRLCMAHVDDVARGHVLAMEHGSAREAYILAGPQTTLVEVLQLTARLAGTSPPLPLPDALVGVSAAAMGRLQRFLPVPADYRAESLRVARMSYRGSAAKAQRELGWFARDLETGLAETVEYLRGI